ncbi:hypothetical protein H4582DRAFT_2085954 [Lactarius indigo]|nr:hypothetical protein H4582DRAFT_2085954 [Lactarius indigo]
MVHPSQIPDTPEPNMLMAWAKQHHHELNAQHFGYTYYMQCEPLLPLPHGLLAERGENLTHTFDLVSVALTLGISPPNQQDEHALSSNAWFWGTTILLSSMITGILDSTSFFKQSMFVLEPCDNNFHLDDAMPVPEMQLNLIKELVAQLSSELTATDNRVMDEEVKWTHIHQMEVIEYKNHIHTKLELEFEEWCDELLSSLVRHKVDDALRMLLAWLEVEGNHLKDQVVRTCQALTNFTALQEAWKVEYNANAAAIEKVAFLDSLRADYQCAVMKEAEVEWHQWKDTELAKVKAEALKSLSLDYILERCGDNAAALIAVKCEFAKGYVTSNYQMWVGQALEEHWLSVEAEAQKWMREQYLNLELTRIWPEVGTEAKALMVECAEKYRETLWKTAQHNTNADLREEQAIQALKTKKKTPKSKTGKQVVEVARRRSPAPLSGLKHRLDGIAHSSLVSSAAPAAFVPEETDMPMALEECAQPSAAGMHTAAVAATILDSTALAYDPGYTSSVEDLYLGHPLPAKLPDLHAVMEESSFPSPEAACVDNFLAPVPTPPAPADTPPPTPALQGKVEGASPPSAPLGAPCQWKPAKGTVMGTSAPLQQGLDSFPPLAPTVAPSVPKHAPAAPVVDKGSCTITGNDGFISIGRYGPSYMVLTAKAIHQQASIAPKVKAHAATQQSISGHTPSGALKPSTSPSSRLITKVVVVRYGSLLDEDAEKKLHANNPGYILLSGNWLKEVAKTGNFIYTIVGKVPMERILTFSKFLCQPFPGSRLVPTEGWCWAQLHDVIIADQDGVLYDKDALADKLACNLCFVDIPFIQPPSWMNNITKIKSATLTVVFAYINPTKSITKAATEAGMSMFSYSVKFVYATDSTPAVPAALVTSALQSILKRPMEIDTPLPPAHVDDAPETLLPLEINLFNDEALAALASAPS